MDEVLELAFTLSIIDSQLHFSLRCILFHENLVITQVNVLYCGGILVFYILVMRVAVLYFSPFIHTRMCDDLNGILKCSMFFQLIQLTL